ncbi:hypothetical protein CPC08DRAFT_648213 [Agrocybe pediades]|nr:hypothetical protein CPC08DRAFT_648213 [Agrocybe pediades]
MGWQCIAPNCDYHAKGNMQRSRILKHSVTCKELEKHDSTASKAAAAASVTGSLGHQLEAASTASQLSRVATSAQTSKPSAESRPVIRQGTLDLVPLRAAGKAAKAAERKHFQDSVDHIITRLICVRGLVPNILGTPEWRELMNKLSSVYTPTPPDTFRHVIIPQEAAFVRDKQIKLLQKKNNLTLTFDGTTIRRNDSFYTAHATTPERSSYLLEAHEGSGESHDRVWIKDHLLKTVDVIGHDRWSALCSDNTAVTRAARRDMVENIPTLLDIWDCVHHLHNTIKDITNLPSFKPAIQTLKSVIKHFSKSSLSTHKLREARALGENDEHVNAIQKVGKTHFRTHWLSATSLVPCLPAIRGLVVSKVIKFKVSNPMISRAANRAYNQFELSLLQYTSIVAPFIRSLWSLEAAHANASDVFIFWLAAAATSKDLFDKDPSKTGIPRTLANEVTVIYNKRYAEFFRNDLYLAAFLLDPRYPNDDFLKLTISLPAQGPSGQAQSTPNLMQLPADIHISKHPRAFMKLWNFLLSMLKPMLERVQSSLDPSIGHPTIRKLGIVQAATSFKREIVNFWNGEYPFRVIGNPANIQDPLGWWQNLANYDGAKVLSILATTIFSVLVNSMPDERTNSTITWFNSPIRGNQSTRTIIDMIQVGQWYGKHDPVSSKTIICA